MYFLIILFYFIIITITIMGSTISYYLQSVSFQSLIDYMNSYDTINYYEKGSNTMTNDSYTMTNDSYNKTISVDDDFYKLFIYVHDFPGMETIKEDYQANALKHNTIVEKYLQCFDDDSNDDSNDDCVTCYDSGFDLLCPKTIVWNETDPIFMLDYKISCVMMFNNKPVGYYLYMRSSTPIKTPLRMANGVGIIDSGYRGTIRAVFDILYSCIDDFEFTKYNRYVQLAPPNIGRPMKVYIVDDLSMLGKKNNRNENGFGSSGD